MLDGYRKLLKIMGLENIVGMDKYAGYVVSCVAITAVVLVLNVWLGRRALSEAQGKARRRAEAQRSES
jgi:heme exporter protein D